ncbi:MAG TPA: hypothetical protein VEL07_07520 [Planctomycetota bacterium]|nr:hypothetical protein [Planctomycetota bacterium]
MRRALGAVIALAATAALQAQDEASLAAARRALGAHEPAQALALLGDLGGDGVPGEAQVLAARCRIALGDAAGARAVIGDDLARMPAVWRGAAALVLAEAALAVGDDAGGFARLAEAIAAGPPSADIDRTLALYAETGLRLDARDEATRAAEILWRRPGGALRARAGLLLARLASAHDASAARAHLAAVCALPDLTADERLTATTMLCRALLPDRPGACLVAAQRELKRGGEVGELPLCRALALALLDPNEGAAALAALPEALAQRPAALAAAAALTKALAAGRVADRAQTIERAAAALELEDWAAARALLEPIAADDGTALALLARVPGFTPSAWLGGAAADDPRAALAVGRAFLVAGDARRAWSLVQRALTEPDPTAHAAALTLAISAARTVAPEAVSDLRARLLALDVHTGDTGLAWCEEAQRLERMGTDATAAWRRAAADLAPDHPWRPAAAWRAARDLLIAGEHRAAADLLATYAGSDGEDDVRRCRFYLLQAWERMGNTAPALELARALMAVASPEQRIRLGIIESRLAATVQPPAVTP